MKLAQEIGDRLTENNALGGMGTAAKNLERHAEAACLKRRQLDLATEIGNRRGQASAHGGLSIIYLEQKDHARAWSHHLQSVEIFKEIGDVAGTGRQHINGAHIRLSQGKQKLALECLDLADRALPKTHSKDRKALSNLRTSIGKLH